MYRLDGIAIKPNDPIVYAQFSWMRTLLAGFTKKLTVLFNRFFLVRELKRIGFY